MRGKGGGEIISAGRNDAFTPPSHESRMSYRSNGRFLFWFCLVAGWHADWEKLRRNRPKTEMIEKEEARAPPAGDDMSSQARQTDGWTTIRQPQFCKSTGRRNRRTNRKRGSADGTICLAVPFLLFWFLVPLRLRVPCSLEFLSQRLCR